uniref:Dynein light chain n=1 Tax=Schistosoma japonicum TaxID=6182 RepID=Q5BSU0_SCHJA|nr:SJCHGC03263 protein [Schistosoma japonicum]
MEETKAIIKSADMSEEIQVYAVDTAAEALETHTIEKDVASFIKKAFDKQYGPTWHCIVGKNFGSYVNNLSFIIFHIYSDTLMFIF